MIRARIAAPGSPGRFGSRAASTQRLQRATPADAAQARLYIAVSNHRLGAQPVQLFVIVIFALLAAVVLYNLYAVLGRRIGRQPTEEAETPAVAAPGERALPAPDQGAQEVELAGLAAVKARDPSFEVDKFLE